MRVTRQRGVRVRCVRALVDGQYGWLVRWIDYRQPVWRQSVFVQHEADARDVVTAVRASVDNRRSPRRGIGFLHGANPPVVKHDLQLTHNALDG